MATRQIDSADWERFFDEFSRAHRGEQAVLHEVGPEIGDQEHATGSEFMGIASDSKGGERPSISIMLGSGPDDHLETTVSRPTRVYVHDAQTGNGDTAMQIEQEEGPKLILEVHAVPQLSGAR